MVRKKNQNKKVDVFLRRISTGNQDLAMQIAADKKYRDVLDEDEYIELNEIGVSANKVKLKEREKMVELLSLINRDMVRTIYVYDRSRLTRNFYEYIELVDLFILNNVQVVFTSSDVTYPPFSSNYLIEGFNGILIEEEGKAIARRVSDVHRKLPAKKYGYDIIKEDGKKSYSLKDEYKEKIINLFEDAKRIEDESDFIQLVFAYSAILKKQPSDIIRIVTDPFYAACEQIGSHLNSLSYVEAAISKELYSEVQQNIGGIVAKLQQNISDRGTENVLPPKCGKCKKKMVYRKNHVGESGNYTCSNKHKRVIVDVDTYNSTLLKTTSLVLANLNRKEIEKVAFKIIATVITNLESELSVLSKRIEQHEYSVATMPIDVLLYQSNLSSEVDKLSRMKGQRKALREQILSFENYELKIRYLIDKLKIQDYLQETELLNLVGLVIKECYVNDSTLSISLYFNEFLDTEQMERMIV